MAYLQCDMDPIRTELPVHIFRLYAAREKDITRDKYERVMNLLPKRNRTENQQTVTTAYV
jgi:hypothetical protein